MLLVVVDEHDIPGWLYPEAFPEVPRPSEDRAEVDDLDFAPLWHALDPTATFADAVEPQPSHCSTGVPHSAPDYVGRVAARLVAALAALPDADRWRVAQGWAQVRLGKRPNEQEKARHKEMLKELCRIAKRSVETRRPLVVL
jgi:hypothetical protein